MKSTAKKTECADEHAGQSGDAVVEGKGISETPEERTTTFPAIRVGDDDPRPVGSLQNASPTGPVHSAESGPVIEPDAAAPEPDVMASDPAAVTEPGATGEDERPAATQSEGSGVLSPGDTMTGDAGLAEDVPVARQDVPAWPADPPSEPGGAWNFGTSSEQAEKPDPRGSMAETPIEAVRPGAGDDPGGGSGTVDLFTPFSRTASGSPEASSLWDPFQETKGDPVEAGSNGAGSGQAVDPAGSGRTTADTAGQEADTTGQEADASPFGQMADTAGSEDADGSVFQSAKYVREVPLPKPVSRALTAALSTLKNSVTGLRLGLDVPGVEEARKAQVEILAQLQNYVIPRVHMRTAPALIVVAGSTGAGKSTLVNTLAAAKVSATGVRRPTTGTPVLACHPEDREWFATGDVLSGMVRVARPGLNGSLDELVLTPSERLPQGVALLDTPDIDSVVEIHHDIAHRMLDAADLWVFVTTATRYADAPAWNLLRLAKERGVRLAIVLSRVPVKSRDVIDKHFARMLQEYGLGDVDRFVINESKVTGGCLPEEEVAELRMWLTELSVDEERRAQAVQATLDGVLNSFRGRVPALARHLEAQVAFRTELRTDVDAAYMRALTQIDEVMSNGSLLRGEVLARWQDFAGSGDLMKTVHLRRPGRLAAKAGQQTPARLRAFKAALRSGLESVIISAGQRAAEEVVTRWRRRDGAGDRLAATPGLGRPSEELVRRAGRTVGAWQEHVVSLIRSGGVAKRSVAKIVSFDEESLSLILMMGLLGYDGSDAAASSGTGTLPERILRGVLGAESLRSIGTRARTDLRARVSVLFDEETLRYVQVLDEAGVPDEAAAQRLYQATYNLEVSR